MNSKQKRKFFSIEPLSVLKGMTVSFAKTSWGGTTYETESWKKIWPLQDSCRMTEILQESCKMTQILHDFCKKSARLMHSLARSCKKVCQILARFVFFSRTGNSIDCIIRTAGVDAAEIFIKDIGWYVLHSTPSMEKHQIVMKRILDKEPTELYYIERTV